MLMARLGDIVNKKNILLFIIYVFTVLIVLYLSKIYKNSISSINDSSVAFNDVTSYSYSVLYDNIYSYSKENPNFLIYVYDKNNSNESFQENVLYIDINGLKNFNYINTLFSDFDYDGSIKKSDLPIYIKFVDGKIVSVGDL